MTTVLLFMLVLLIHFGLPLFYYLILKIRYLNKPWNIDINTKYQPKITVIIPTYNEAELISEKLNNVAFQDYPKDKLKILVIDSNSQDDTPLIVSNWKEKRKDINIELINENVRKGKVHSLNRALNLINDEIVVITDADSRWHDNDTLSKLASLFYDKSIGAVTCIKKPLGSKSIEESYRHFYNIVRIAESKIYSTPVFHGELAAFRKTILSYLGGFPIYTGSDDSHTATLIAILGYRAIAYDELKCEELVPKKEYFLWRIRRSQHLAQHFFYIVKHIGRATAKFKVILLIETFLHLVNPWLLLVALILLVKTMLINLLLLAFFISGIVLLLYKPYRVWIFTQLFLILGMIKNIFGKEIMWKKQEK